MITIRSADSRGRTELDWLDSRHSFSFGDYHDRNWLGFRSLRVINDDRVAPRGGFGMHPHRDMEIITWVLSGALEHRDSLKNGSLIRPGEIQRMSAGTGILHSEFNPSATEPVHLLQIWLFPERKGLTPGYEQRVIGGDTMRNRFRPIATRDGRDGSVTIHQDASVYAAGLETGQNVSYELGAGRYGWLHVAKGKVLLNGQELGAGDGAAVSDERLLKLTGVEPAELLLFELA
jgi:redox-sensitive bicupin YhaK (pirin superfamily)